MLPVCVSTTKSWAWAKELPLWSLTVMPLIVPWIRVAFEALLELPVAGMPRFWPDQY